MSAVTVTRIGVMTYLGPLGALVGEEMVGSLREAVDGCVSGRNVHLVMDLAKVPAVSGLALEALLDAHDTLSRLGGGLKLAGPSSVLVDVLRSTRVERYLEVIDPERGAGAAPPVPHHGKRLLGDIILEQGLAKEAQIQEAVRLQRQLGKRLGNILVEKGWVSEVDMLKALSVQLEIPYVALRAGLYDPQALTLLSREAAARLEVLPMFRVRGELTLATANAQSVPVLDEVERVTGCTVCPVLARREDILKLINEAYGGSAYIPDYTDDLGEEFEVVESQIPEDYATIDEMAAGSPVVNLVNIIIQRAVRDGASDVHIEPARAKSRVRFRIDGVLYEVMTPRVEMHPALVSRLKVMANLDIAERRLPQDGRIQVATQGRTVDLRFSSLPGIFGEKVVLRVLDKNQSLLDVSKLGMAPVSLEDFRKLLGASNGLILVTGPTGSGKTTTLYAALNHINSLEKNIVTIEDPVEYQIDIVNQNQVNAAIGLSFARVLKHVLRQDPDIVMVGEIRERETAEIAVQAALTGHLVLSTLHTNDSVGAITRLLDMGVEPYLLSSALAGVVSQRLVRRVCPECRTSYLAPPEMVERFGWDPATSHRMARGRGCQSCYDSGYKGRLGLYEILETDTALQRLMLSNPGKDELAAYLGQRDHRTLFDDGVERVREGATTLEELSRVVHS